MNTDDSIYAKEIATLQDDIKDIMEFIDIIGIDDDNVDDTLPTLISVLPYEVTTVELAVS